jgi:lipopolysaccharide biosynthesis protein
MENNKTNARLIAFHLPQFHPIPENDRWWGKGFTEWTNVAKAKPLFRGHYQPHVPTDLGFYDLRVPETRIAQAEMAQAHGIEGFAYWHYWFAGKRLLERPVNDVVKSGSPDFPFCLAWANQTWTGIWHGAPNRILIEQTYPGKKDYEAHFYAVVDALADDRYIRVDSKPVFIIYNPYDLPNPKMFTDLWRELALKAGLEGLYFIGQVDNRPWTPADNGFDAAFTDVVSVIRMKMNGYYHGLGGFTGLVARKVLNRIKRRIPMVAFSRPTIYSYADVVNVALPELSAAFDHYPCVIPNWDNTPRSGANGLVFQNATPELFKQHLQKAIGQVDRYAHDKKLVFIKSWNEWAEGNYLEPERKFGNAYLEAVREVNFTMP